MIPEPRAYSPEELRVGMTALFERDVTEEDILTFARNSGDLNPLHVDADYARTTNYQGRIAHGAFQVGLASAMAGMYLPGRHVVLGSINARFVAPLRFPCRVQVHGEITSWNLPTLGGQLKVRVQESSARMPVAEIVMAFSFHEQRPQEAPQAQAIPTTPGPAGQRLVLVTGAAGAIGAEIVAALAQDCRVLAMVHRTPLPESLRARPGVAELAADLSAQGWEDMLAAAVGDGHLYGVVHAAWPGAPRGGLLDVQEAVLERQLAFGTTCTIRLARCLFAHVGPEGGRFAAMGSVAGTRRPMLPLAAYSLGKAALESAVALLAPELARKRITINALCPSFVPAGINEQASERQRTLETARVPMGRLCLPEDIAATIRFLLSPAASFVSGQTIALTGAQL